MAAAVGNLNQAQYPQSFWDVYIHIGYSVTSGRYFDGEELIAGSSPTSPGGRTCGLLFGSVLIMSHDSAAPPHKVQWPSDYFPWGPRVIINGGAFGSYFGAAMESVDVNRDGLDDLIVGAPLECVSKTGGATDGQDCIEEAGCVYLYSHHVIACTDFQVVRMF